MAVRITKIEAPSTPFPSHLAQYLDALAFKPGPPYIELACVNGEGDVPCTASSAWSQEARRDFSSRGLAWPAGFLPRNKEEQLGLPNDETASGFA